MNSGFCPAFADGRDKDKIQGGAEILAACSEILSDGHPNGELHDVLRVRFIGGEVFKIVINGAERNKTHSYMGNNIDRISLPLVLPPEVDIPCLRKNLTLKRL